MNIFVADIGGTSSKFRIYQNDKIIKEYSSHSYNASDKSNSDIINFINQHLAPNIHYSIFGFAGLSDTRANSIQQSKKNLIITSDVELARFDAFKNDDGLVLILGTGMILYGKVNSNLFRTGGNGFLFDSASGAFRLGQLFLQTLLLESDKNIKSEFLEHSLSLLGILKEDLRAYCRELYLNKDFISIIADKSKILLKLYNQENMESVNLINRFLLEIQDYLNLPFNKKIDIVLFGGLMKNKRLKNKLIKILENNKIYTCIEKNIDPLQGGLEIAKEYFE